MRTCIAALAMLAATASASIHFPGQHHFHYPRGNGSESSTTLTVKTTQVHTVTSCAPTVTNCPAHAAALAALPDSQKVTKTVTEDVVLTETVCPVAEASKIEASIKEKAATAGINGTTPTTEATGGAVVTPVVTDKTVTFAQGSGASASTVTSTIRSTIWKTLTPGSVGGPSAAAPESAAPESTTTMTSTTKVTRTVTLSKVKATATETLGGANKAAECAASTVTVKETVTVAASTVYVTVSGSPATSSDVAKAAASHPSADQDDNKFQVVSSDCDHTTSTVEAVVTVVPYPSGNGTHHSGKAKPSGFTRFVR